MADCVTALAGVRLPHPSLASHLSNMRMLHKQLRIVRASLPASVVVSGIQVDLMLFATDVAVLLTAVVQQLDRLGTRLICRPPGHSLEIEESVFWELWSFAAVCCEAFGSATLDWPTLWDEDNQSAFEVWYAAFHSFVTWLLPFSRSPAWLCMQRQHGMDSRNQDLTVIFMQPVATLLSLTLTPTPTHVLLGRVSLAHLDFLPLLCCIASEQFGDLPLLVARDLLPVCHPTLYTQGLTSGYGFEIQVDVLLESLVVLVNNLAVESIILGPDKRSTPEFNFISILTHPAIVQCVKTVLVLPRGGSAKDPAHLDMVQISTDCLVLLLSLHVKHCKAPIAAVALDVEREAIMDAMGLPVHLNPFLSRPARETDGRVLHALSRHMDNSRHMDGELESWHTCFSAQAWIMQDWHHACRMHPVLSGVHAEMVRSVIGVAKQFSLYVLECLLRISRARDHQPGHHKHSSCSQPSNAAVPKMSELAAFGCSKVIRDLLLLTSHFQVQRRQDGKLVSFISEWQHIAA